MPILTIKVFGDVEFGDVTKITIDDKKLGGDWLLHADLLQEVIDVLERKLERARDIERYGYSREEV